MGKYTSPVVTWKDAVEALPRLQQPLSLIFTVRVLEGQKDRCAVAVELLYSQLGQPVVAFKRWGKFASLNAPNGVQAAALLAAHDAHAYCKGKDALELLELIAWELGLPLTHPDGR